jgi:hypothetical protein
LNKGAYVPILSAERAAAPSADGTREALDRRTRRRRRDDGRSYRSVLRVGGTTLTGPGDISSVLGIVVEVDAEVIVDAQDIRSSRSDIVNVSAWASA